MFCILKFDCFRRQIYGSKLGARPGASNEREQYANKMPMLQILPFVVEMQKEKDNKCFKMNGALEKRKSAERVTACKDKHREKIARFSSSRTANEEVRENNCV